MHVETWAKGDVPLHVEWSQGQLCFGEQSIKATFKNLRILEPPSFEHDFGNFLRAQGTILVTVHNGARSHEESVVEIFFADFAVHLCRREP